MSAQAPSRPVTVDELRRAWHAVSTGEFRNAPVPGLDAGADHSPRGRGADAETAWSPAAGEHTIVVLGCAGSVGASTVALATGLAAVAPARVVECCSVTASGLAAATNAELGLHPRAWRQGWRDHVLLERASRVLTGVDQVPLPPAAEHEHQLTILDVGWETGQLLATDCWLADAVRTADRVVLVTTATIPGMRRLGVAIDLLATHWQPERLAVAVRGPRRKKWPRGLEHAGSPAVRRVLDADRCVEIPNVRGLDVNGLDSRPLPAPLLPAARRLLDPAHLPTDDSTP